MNLTTTSGCAWWAQSNASWLTTTNQSGSGSATIYFSVAANMTASITSQEAQLNIAGNVFYVSQTTVPVSAAMTYVPVTPCRVADTRGASGPFGGPYITGQTTRGLAILLSVCTIPSAATAYSLNVAVVPHGALGYLTVWPDSEPQPLVATLNSDGRIKSNAAILNAGANGAVNFFATNDTDLVADINGYFVPATTNTGLDFFVQTPCRISDTRLAAGPLGGAGSNGRSGTRHSGTAIHVQRALLCAGLLTEFHGSSARSAGIPDHLADRTKPTLGSNAKLAHRSSDL